MCVKLAHPESHRQCKKGGDFLAFLHFTLGNTQLVSQWTSSRNIIAHSQRQAQKLHVSSGNIVY